MSILSLTFHTTEQINNEWESYSKNELQQIIDNLMEVEKYILSEVETEMITEGKNTNLLLIFNNDEARNQFIENKLINITEIIEQKFRNDAMIFKTLLNPKKIKI